MARKRVQNVVWKEWEVIFTDLNSALIITLLPLLIVGQGALYIWLASVFGGESILSVSVFQTALGKLAAAMPQIAPLDTETQFRVLLLNQFSFFLLLIPIMIAVNVATFSIVDEKVTGSLEALLATPVRTEELLLGKALAGAVPALVMAWISAGIFLLVVVAMGWGELINFVLTPSWFISLFLLTPAVVLLSFTLGVIGSSRAKDAKGAQNFAVLIILPVLALIGVQVTGQVWFTPVWNVALALGIGIIDFVALKGAVRLFQRESILIQWR
jgi:ABC-2 type transport system permease protein